MAQVATPGNIQNANNGNGGNGNSEKCHVSDFELPQDLLDATADANFPGPPQIFGLVAGITAGWDPALKLHETPIAIRFTWLISALNWNCAAVYSQKWDDALTKTDPIIRTPKEAKKVDASSGLFVQEKDVPLHTSDTRFLCLVHGWHAVLEDWIPDATETLLPVLESLGLNFTEESLGYDEDVGECFADVAAGEVADAICLERIAKDNCYKPAIMGQIVGRQVAEYARTDGKSSLHMYAMVYYMCFLASIGSYHECPFDASAICKYKQVGTKMGRLARTGLHARQIAVAFPTTQVVRTPATNLFTIRVVPTQTSRLDGCLFLKMTHEATKPDRRTSPHISAPLPSLLHYLGKKLILELPRSRATSSPLKATRMTPATLMTQMRTTTVHPCTT